MRALIAAVISVSAIAAPAAGQEFFKGRGQTPNRKGYCRLVTIELPRKPMTARITVVTRPGVNLETLCRRGGARLGCPRGSGIRESRRSGGDRPRRRERVMSSPASAGRLGRTSRSTHTTADTGRRCRTTATVAATTMSFTDT